MFNKLMIIGLLATCVSSCTASNQSLNYHGLGNSQCHQVNRGIQDGAYRSPLRKRLTAIDKAMLYKDSETWKCNEDHSDLNRQVIFKPSITG